ncbi:MAG TPA: hypothetical protein VN306_06910 [Mycobacterium sp.]|nr:hypothetical protein [Mycobacterium sp.]
MAFANFAAFLICASALPLYAATPFAVFGFCAVAWFRLAQVRSAPAPRPLGQVDPV